VLNVAIDAGALLRLMRRKLEAAGGAVLDGRAFRTVRVAADGPLHVEVELEALASGATERFSARLLLDGMGSTSPLALRRHEGRPFAAVCPTVGTVASGFAQGDRPDEVDHTLGDILVSVADAQRGEQLMWEGFPGRGDELTVYLFYYATVGAADDGPPGGLRSGSPRYSLLDLFEQYFLLLPSYKRPGPAFRHVKPVYGYIPARHSLRRQEAPLLRGVLPVGDSAAQQSPLTFCGFGSHVRNLGRTTGLLEYALRHELLEPNQLATINPFQTNVALNWAFSRFMHPWDRAHDVNRLQNLFLEVLTEHGVERATRFFRDRMRWSDYHPLLFGVLMRWPQILLAAWRVLGPAGVRQWAGDYVRFSAAALAAATARRIGPAAERRISQLADRYAPALGLRLRAHYAEWRAMGWI
jgi:lycopene cyclase CruA